MISIIICTYNRPKKVNELIELLLKQTVRPEEIIVVDSSDEINYRLKQKKKINYIRSSHKNQPYQRYLGYLVAGNEWLLYLDDDMEPVNDRAIEQLKHLQAEKPKVDAFAIRFENVHEDTSLSAIPKTKIKKGNTPFGKLIRWITAYPVLPVGYVGWNGVRGSQPKGGFTEWFSGGAFMARKKVLFQNFNFGLFAMFERRLGMGEDFIIAYSIAQIGRIWATDKVYFLHNDQKDSTYTVDVESFDRRVIYSRLYLSLEKARLNKKTRFVAVSRYIYYSIWRGLGIFANLILSPSKKRISALKGFVRGFFSSFELLRVNLLEMKTYWHNEAQKDLN